jgi:hypothetical protein
MINDESIGNIAIANAWDTEYQFIWIDDGLIPVSAPGAPVALTSIIILF